MKKIGIIDYGIGNVRSISNALKRLNFSPVLTSDKEELMSCDGVILPGVGAFRVGMENLKERGLISVINELSKTSKPFLGVCLGMQLLFDSSEEYGHCDGLGLIPGQIKNLRPMLSNKVKVPHIGWNHLTVEKSNSPEEYINAYQQGTDVYFVHSYAAFPTSNEYIVTSSEYEGVRFCSTAQKENVIGMQFHPEKSGEMGLGMLRKIFE